jgi:hypothetical protein
MDDEIKSFLSVSTSEIEKELLKKVANGNYLI